MGLWVHRRPVPSEGSAFFAFWRPGKEIRYPNALVSDSPFRSLTRHPQVQPVRLRFGFRPQPSQTLRGGGERPPDT